MVDTKKLALVAMSGGVDSSVAALLLKKQGFDVVGITMRLYTPKTPALGKTFSKSCCSVEDVEDARQVCHKLGIRHQYINFEKEFKKHVIDRFVQEYSKARTPYPCLSCNDSLKFDELFRHADLIGASVIATGHYARLKKVGGLWELFCGIDQNKDQAYVLYNLKQSQLERLMFPVGDYTKDEIRKFAHEAGFVVADKPDSQDICFLPNGNYQKFVEERLTKLKTGNIVDTVGNKLGEHGGIHRFTIGQRKRIPISTKDPMYVNRIDETTGEVVVGTRSEASSNVVYVSDINWISGSSQTTPLKVLAKVRYSSRKGSALFSPDQPYSKVTFDEPMWAVTPGQALVFYDGYNGGSNGERVLGGGTIVSKSGKVNTKTKNKTVATFRV